MAFRTIFGFWSKPSASHPIDIEAQAPQPIAGTYTTLNTPPISTSPFALPPRAFTQTPRILSPITDEKEELTNPIDDFFGASPARRTRSNQGTADSRHDERPLPTSLPPSQELPPPYIYPSPASPENELPSYAQSVPGLHGLARIDAHKESVTLAEYLFRYGFFFPLLWLLSIPILLSPLNAPEGWEPTKSAAERTRLLREMRATETKWARRSLLAFALLAAVVATIVLAIVFVRRA